MTELTDQQPVKPWFKEPWLLFLIALPTVVVIASLNLVFVSFKNADSVVADNYYKEGLAINQQMADIEQAKNLGISITLQINKKLLEVEVTPALDKSITTLNLELRHPLDHRFDQKITLGRNSQGGFNAALPEIKPGSWHIDIYSNTGENPWRIKQRIQFPQAKLSLSADEQL